ncbi:MAG TPA: ferritin [bacterium]|nr:ferritin [bacterium]
MDSAYLYLSMSAWFEGQGFDGMAAWMRVQAMEEQEHAMKFFDHIQERDGRVELLALSKPKAEWSSPQNAFEEAYKHEQFITGKIHDLVKLSQETRDFPSTSMLNWFVDEQVEEEANASKIVQTLERVGNSGNGLVMLDRKLGERGKE